MRLAEAAKTEAPIIFSTLADVKTRQVGSRGAARACAVSHPPKHLWDLQGQLASHKHV